MEFYNHQMMMKHKRFQIPRNIEKGEMIENINKRLQACPFYKMKKPQMLEKLKNKLLAQHKKFFTSEEKRNSLDEILKKIKENKTNFAKENQDLGIKINEFYQDQTKVQIPQVIKQFPCKFCGNRYVNNQRLVSHYKGCKGKKHFQEQQVKKEMDDECQNQNFKLQPKVAKKIGTTIVQGQSNLVKKEETKQKKVLPLYSCNSFADIFQEDQQD